MEKKNHVRKILWRCLKHVEKKKLCLKIRTMFKEGHYFYFLRLWACGLTLLFFGLWVFCGSSSFFLEGTVGYNNFWIGQFGKKKLNRWTEWSECASRLPLQPLSGVKERLSRPLFMAEWTKLCACAQAFYFSHLIWFISCASIAHHKVCIMNAMFCFIATTKRVSNTPFYLHFSCINDGVHRMINREPFVISNGDLEYKFFWV